MIVVDIETVPTDRALAREADESYLMAGVASTWGDEAVAKHRAKRAALWAKELPKIASLDWRLGRIACIGLYNPDLDGAPVALADQDERKLLESFWELLAGTTDQIVGFNIRNFDWPYLVGRSAMQSVKASRVVSASRYGFNNAILDWADVLSNYGAADMKGWTLEAYAVAFDLPHRPIGTGADVWPAWQAGEIGKIRDHCVADLAVTLDLDARCRPSFLGVAP